MKRPNRYYILLFVLIATYTCLSLFLPQDNSAATTRYGLSDQALKVITLTFAIPMMVIWTTAFTGFIKVKQYADLAGKSKDGQAFRLISQGLMLLAFSLPVNALVSTLRNYISNQQASLIPTATIIANYVSLAISLAGIWLVARGARKLAGSLKDKPHTLNQAVMASIFTAFCIFYTYLTLTDPLGQTPGGIAGRAVYYLPDALVLATIIVPYICLWYLGFRAAYHIQLYRKNAPGILYQQALGYLSAGIASVVMSLMVLRLATSLTSFLDDLSLRGLLAIVYVLLIIIGLGYYLIAYGANRLKKIEEV